MTREDNAPADLFDPDTLARLFASMAEHGIADVELQRGADRVRVRRGGDAPGPEPPPASTLALANGAAGPQVVRAPAAGVLHFRQPGPAGKALVHVGATVGPSDVVAMIEAGDHVWEIEACCTGVVRRLLASDEGAVERGSPLLEVDPAA